ncbi:type II restriction endonuclease [Parabacteroides faecis]|uniref:type II restriction endonuclease n=1 Tax=Parabacteroides faecis TaxID=1217282 RepID=UPI00374492C5
MDKDWRKGINTERKILIKWQNDFETSSKIKYYGCGTRNEFRITCFGRNFPFLQDDNVGDVLIICQMDTDNFQAFILQADNDIDDFMASFNLSSNDTNHFINKNTTYNPEKKLKEIFSGFISQFSEFPPTKEMAIFAMNCYIEAWRVSDQKVINEIDKQLLKWIETEFNLFKAFEEKLYTKQLTHLFTSIEEQVKFSNMVLNCRKSCAGKSLEHHLETFFQKQGLIFEYQPLTENNKKTGFYISW